MSTYAFKCRFCSEPLRFDWGACPGHLGALFASEEKKPMNQSEKAAAFQFAARMDAREFAHEVEAARR